MNIGFSSPTTSIGATAIEQPGEAPSQVPGAPYDALSPAPSTETPLGDDAIYEIAALLAQAASDDRKNARGLRNARERMFEDQTTRRIQAIRDKADAARTAAMINGAAGMAAGACQVAGGLSSMSEASRIQTTGEQVTLTKNEQTGALALGRVRGGSELSSTQLADNTIVGGNAQAYGQLGSGISGCLQSSGGLVSALFTHAAENHEADAAQHEAKAARAARGAEDCSDEMKDAKQLMDKVMDFLKEIRASQNGAAQAAILRG